MRPLNSFQTIHSALLEKLLAEQLKLEGQWDVAFSQISYQSIYQNVIEGKFMFIDINVFKVV